MDIAETLRALESSLLNNAVRKDSTRVKDLLPDEFTEFGRSGAVYTKAEILSFLQEEQQIAVTMKEFACRIVAAEVVLVTYRSERTHPDGSVIEALRSSLWVWRHQRWQMIFHQSTPSGQRAAA